MALVSTIQAALEEGVQSELVNGGWAHVVPVADTAIYSLDGGFDLQVLAELVAGAIAGDALFD